MVLLDTKVELGHSCTFLSSSESCPVLVQLVPAIVLSVTCNSNPGLQFKSISITIFTRCPFGLGHCNELFPLPHLQHWLIHRPKSPLGSMCSCGGLSTILLHLLQHNLTHRPQSIQGSTCSGVDCSMATSYTSGCACSSMHVSSHSPLDLSSSLSSTAPQEQQQCPGHLPAHCCYQYIPRQNRMIRRTGNSRSKKQALTSTRLYSEASKPHGKHRSLPVNS